MEEKRKGETEQKRNGANEELAQSRNWSKGGMEKRRDGGRINRGTE